MCFSDSQSIGNGYLASKAIAGVHIYKIKYLKFYCTVHAYILSVTALAISPNTNSLVIAHSDQPVFEYSISDKQYTE